MRKARTDARSAVVNGGYVAGPFYDWCFFILSPLLAMVLGWLVRVLELGRYEYVSSDGSGALRRIAIPALLSAAFTHAHLVIVFFRSHLNREIFRRHPARFTVVPIALLLASIASQWVFVVASVLTVWWDVYHSSLQTFGLGRIYDRRAGGDVEAGRRADYLFNLVVYVGPVLAGTSLWGHLRSFQKLERIDGAFLSQLADVVFARREDLRAAVIGVGLVFLAAYLLHYARLVRRGHVVPGQKVALYTVTGVVSIACWGFGSFGEAFLIMNFFHALQYFAIVWATEKRTIMRAFGCRWPVALFILLASGLGYGLWRSHRPEDYLPFVALGNVVSLMHFWYDGFVWSVRRGQV